MKWADFRYYQINPLSQIIKQRKWRNIRNMEALQHFEMKKLEIDKKRLMEKVAPYRKSDHKKAIWQLVNTLLPYGMLWVAIVFLLQQDLSFWIVLPFIVLAGFFLVRIFIIFHDCCHGSFFTSNKANKFWGYFTGILTLTPFYQWRRDHSLHHATAGNLDQRGSGDVWTMTVNEYISASPLKRLGYRLYRNPLVLLGLGPVYSFILSQRFSGKNSGKRERFSIWFTNGALLAVLIVAGLIIGFKNYLLIQISIMAFGGMLGVWLFYIQHQFDGVYWARQDHWDSLKASLQGSSYYHLPKILQWFTGNIGIHHIHHVEPRIPNYHLQQCYNEMPVFQNVKALTITESLRSLWMNLWDEKNQKLVSFRSLKRLQHEAIR